MTTLEDDITVLYGEARARPLLRRLEELARPERQGSTTSFDEGAVLLLAYPDHVSSPDCAPLQALGRLLSEHFEAICSGVHVLPPFPSSGDGGFAPVEHLTISPELGSWADISELATRFALSLDLILNHVSPRHTWFRRFMAGDAEYAQFFIEVAQDADFSAVARSRHHPPVTVFGTAAARKQLWTRYGNEQVDLNYGNPLVLARMLDVLVSYAERGVSGVRLDAIAFIWKQLGTSCSNLPEVMRILRVLRRVADGAGRGMFLIAEADAVDGENPYVGGGDELAHLSYRYEAAPIILHAIIEGKADLLQRWIARLSEHREAGRVLSFLCTHDGIYLRPKAPPLPEEALQSLIRRTEAAGGRVIWREVNGRLRPYELDVTVIDLLDTGDERTLARLFAALALVVTLPGVPLLYLGTLLGARNDHDQVRATRDPRAINRRKLSLDDARARISAPSPHRQFLERLSALIRARRRLEAFAPQASIIPIPALGDMVAFERRGRNTWARCYISLNGESVRVSLPEGSTEICSGRRVGSSAEVAPMSPLIVGGEL